MKYKIFSIILFAIIILISSYFFFDGNLFLGGDNSRTFIYFPDQYLNFILNGGINFSDFPINGAYKPQFHLFFIVKFLSFFDTILPTYYLGVLMFFIINFTGFLGIMMVLGIFQDKIDKQLSTFYLKFLLSTLYILIPIVYLSFSSFFAGVFLIAAGPWIIYSSIEYLRNGKLGSLVILSFICLFFGVAFYGIPWIISLLVIMIIYCIVFFNNNSIKRISTILGVIVLSSLFWMIPFFIQFGESNNQLVGVSNISNTFEITVNNTSRGNNIIYPLSYNFHPSIAQNYNWQYNSVYKEYYKNYILFFLILFFISLYGILLEKDKKTLSKENIFGTISLLVLLFLFTVNIGVFKDIFLSMGNIPSFSMFRNFYDKFSVSYGIVLIIFTFLGLKIIKNRKFIIRYLFCINLIFLVPFLSGNYLSNTVWQTDIPSLINNFDEEYINILDKVKATNSIFGKNLILPFSISQYTSIGDKRGLYVGLESSFILNGTKNIVSQKFIKSIYESCINNENQIQISCFELKNSEKGIEFAIINKAPISNIFIYNGVTKAYSNLFEEFIKNNYQISYENSKYTIYGIGNIKTNSGLNKVDEYKYGYLIENINSPKEFKLEIFYSNFWETYIGKEKIILNHNPSNNNYNKWIISKQEVINHVNTYYSSELEKEGYPKTLENGSLDYKYYILNPDGTIDVELTLYFKPQKYFYTGLIISSATFALLILWLVINTILEKNKQRKEKNGAQRI